MANLKVDLTLNDGNLKKQINDDKKAVSEFGQTVANSGQSVRDQATNFQRAVGSITNYKRQLATLTKEVISLEMSYKSLTDEQKKSDFGQALAAQLSEAKDRAAEFKDQIIDTQNEIVKLSSDSFKSDVFASGIDVVSTSMSAMVAVTELAGGETENLQKAITKLVLIQTTAAASIQIINALQAQSSLMLGVRKAQEYAAATAIAIKTAAEGKSVIVTKAATVAQAAFNAVAKANPYVLLASAIIAVGGALVYFANKSGEATDAQKKQAAETERLEKRNANMAQTVGKYVGDVLAKYKSLQVQWSLLSTEHEKSKWVKDNSDAFRQLGLNVKSVTDAEQVLVNMSAQVITALKAVAEAEAYSDLYKQSIQKKATEWDRRTKGRATGDAYTVYHAGDAISDAEARAAGVRTNAERTRTVSLGGYASHTTVSNLTKDEVDKVNNYRRNEAIKLNRQLERQYDEDTNYFLNKWTEAAKAATAARAQIPHNLQYNGNGGNGGTNGNTGNSNTNKPTVEVETKFAEGSLAALENQLSELQSKYKNGLITLTPSDYQKKVNELTQSIEKKKIELGLYVPEDKVTKQLQAVEEKNAKLARSQSFSSFDLAVGNNLPQNDRDISYIQSQMDFNDQLLQQLRELQQAYKELGDAGKNGLTAINSEIENVTNKQTQLGAKAKEYTEQDKKLKEQTETWNNVGNAVSKVGGAFSSLGGAFEIPALNIAGIIAQSIANIISAYTQAANSPSVTATGWGWLGFALTGLAEVASVISQIHSLSGFAEGGIIKGNGSAIKDDTLIMAHAGEMVLNQAQQSRLFNMLNGQYSSTNNVSAGSGQVEFVLRGADLYGTLKNYGKMQSLVGHHIGIK